MFFSTQCRLLSFLHQPVTLCSITLCPQTKNRSVRALHTKSEDLLPEEIEIELDVSTEGLSSGSYNSCDSLMTKALCSKSFQLVKDPMILCAFDWTTATGKLISSIHAQKLIRLMQRCSLNNT